jgi:hypothetical protein
MPGSMNGFGLENGSVPINRKSVSFLLQVMPHKQKRRTSFVITSRFLESPTILQASLPRYMPLSALLTAIERSKEDARQSLLFPFEADEFSRKV